MDSNQVLHIIDKYFNTIDMFGDINDNKLNTLLYLMFIDEYYEIRRNELLINKTSEYALNDCVVKKLNKTLNNLQHISIILQNEILYELPSVIHWIIPELPEDDDYIENNILYVKELDSNVLKTTGEIINNILKL